MALALSMDLGLFRFIYRKRGVRLLLVAIQMTLLQNVCKLVAAVGGGALYAYRLLPSEKMRWGDPRSCILEQRRLPEE